MIDWNEQKENICISRNNSGINPALPEYFADSGEKVCVKFL